MSDSTVERAAAVLGDRGRLIVIGTSQAAWARHAGAVASDLAPGRPLHAET